MKLHTVYKGTLSGVLFALIVQKIPLSNFFYASTATDASDKYEVCHPAGHSCWIGPTLPSSPLPSQAIPGQTSSFTLLLSDGLIPNLIFSSPKRHNCWTFLAEIFFSELLRVWACACAALGGRGAGAHPQRVLQPLQHRLLLRLHQGEREGESNHFLFEKFKI